MLQRLSNHAYSWLLVTLAAATLVAGPACSGVGDFNITRESGEKVVEGGGLTSLLPIDPLTFNVNLEQALEKRDAKGAKAVYLERLTLKVTGTKMPEGDTDNFNFLESMTFTANADGKDAKKIAEIQEVPRDRQSIDLNVDNSVNLKPYIQQGLKLETSASGNPPDDDTSIKGVITLRIEVL